MSRMTTVTSMSWRHSKGEAAVAESSGCQVNAPGLTDRGDVVGFDTAGGRQLAFRRDRDGTYQPFEAPTPTPASGTLPISINTPGDVVGQYTHAGVTRGFVLYRTRTPEGLLQ